MKEKEKGNKRFFKRDWIQKNEGQLTYVQFFGFVLIVIGIIYFSSFLLPDGIKNFWFLKQLLLESGPNPGGISIAFFTTMLGVAFAFPEMLKGGRTNEMSTMRITVFMFTNVICMLLLKIGWGKEHLSDIGLDSSWVGIIAFLFGAKAAQSYFENADKIRTNTTNPSEGKSSHETPDNGNIGDLNISQIAIAQLAKVQNEEKLHEQFPSIEFVSDTLKNGVSCLTIYLEDTNTQGIPSSVDVKINEGNIVKVQTEIISGMGTAKPHLAQLTNNICNSNTPKFVGSICCLVESTLNSDIQGVLTSGHIFTKGEFENFNGFVSSNQRFDSLSNGNSIGQLYFQQMISNQDLAIVKLNNSTSIGSEVMKFPSGFYTVSQSDLNSPTPNITILSRNNKSRNAFIVDRNISMKINYGSCEKIMRNIILIGTSTDKNQSVTVSVGGDSGSCVYHSDKKQLVGMLLGGNDKFSFVLPIEKTLIDNNFKLI